MSTKHSVGDRQRTYCSKLVSDESLENEEGHRYHSAIDDNQLRAITEIGPRKTTREVAGEGTVNRETVGRHSTTKWEKKSNKMYNVQRKLNEN